MQLVKEKSNTYTSGIPEKQYEELYSKAGILYFVTDAKCCILSCNVTAREKLNYEKENFIGKNFLDIVAPGEHPHFSGTLEKCINRGFIKDEETFLMPDSGAPIPVQISGLVETDEDGVPAKIRFYVRDMAETYWAGKHKDLSRDIILAMRELASPEERLEKILGSIQKRLGAEGVGLFLSDFRGQAAVFGNWKCPDDADEEKHSFRRWPPPVWKKFIEMACGQGKTGLTEFGSFWTTSLTDLIIQMHPHNEIDNLVSLEDYEAIIIVPIYRNAGMTDYLVLLHTKAGKWQFGDVELLESISPLMSVSEEGHAAPDDEKAEDYKAIMDVSVCGVLLVKDGIIQEVNSRVEEMLGLPAESITGKSILDFVTEGSRPVIHKLVESGPDNQEIEAIEICPAAGCTVWVDCDRVPLSMNGSLTEMWCWVDKANHLRLQEQLIRARKMETLGLLAGGIVHEFNNLLATILGYNSLLSEEISKESPYYEDLQQITRTSERATELTSRLLAFAEGRSYQINELDVNQLIREVATILSRTLDKRIAIRAELNDDLNSIKADAGQVQQAILQVALNARDAMENGGKIVFRSSNLKLNQGDIRLKEGKNPGNYILIEISDTGLGMSSQTRDKVFDPGFSTKKDKPGKGLGMSMVRDIVEQHGGFISLFSEKSKGTVVKIYFPANEKKAIRKSRPSDTGIRPALGKETILLVDDEKMLKEAARKMLTRYGYKVITAESAPEAIAIYKKYKNRIDLIILDMIIPGMDVKQVLAWFRKVNPKVKIVASTNLGEQDYFEQNFSASVAGFIQKPFQVRPLLNQIRTIISA